MHNQPEHADNIHAWLRLNGAEGIGPTTFTKLLKYFGSPEAALSASSSALEQVKGLGPAKAQKIVSTRDHWDADKEIALANKLGVCILHMHDPRYPLPLQGIYDPPPVLYVKGRLLREHTLAVALVGSRQCSLYGQEQAARLAYQLSAGGFTIVSGMARGIDTSAHQGALSGGGQTLAVQGCGLARCFPPENRRLFQKITQNGACLSEFPLTYEPLPQNFPARNRIIAGLSLGTVIVEAAPRSGALITARCALEQNREVLAVPGRIDSPLSRGPHQLLRQGATLVTCAQDIVAALGPIGKQLEAHMAEAARQVRTEAARHQNECPIPLNREEQEILTQLSETPLHTDQLVERTGQPVGQIMAHLVSLQLKGLARSLPGNLFVRR